MTANRKDYNNQTILIDKSVEFYGKRDYMIKRDKYLNQLIKAMNNGFPKVITGIRRCGKSYLLKEIFREYLIETGIDRDLIIVIELDDLSNSSLRDPVSLNSYILDLTDGKNEKHYVFLDEIQRVYTIVNPELTEGRHILAKPEDKEVISFVDVVLGLSHRKNIDLYVTGSNSKMLSSDIVTEFRDKATEIKMAPLSFFEYHEYSGGSVTDDLFEFMHHGGMPLAVLSGEDEREQYLKNLFKATYFKDILERNKLRKEEALDELCTILSSCTGEFLNVEKIANTFESRTKNKICKETVDSYINAFIDAFIIYPVNRFDLKGRKEIGALRKYYFSDTGLRNARLDFVFPDEGQMLENIVLNELLYRDYSVSVGCFEQIEKDKKGKSVRKSYEVDFRAVKGKRSMYIQIASDTSKEETMKREVRPFVLLNDQITKVLVVNKPIREMRDCNGFTILGITEFLLNYI